MTFNNRVEFLDHCIAGERSQFNSLLSKTNFNTFDRGYELFRDYIKQKGSITNISCEVCPDSLTFHISSKKPMDEIVSEGLPKRGITQTATDTGVDLNIKLIDVVVL